MSKSCMPREQVWVVLREDRAYDSGASPESRITVKEIVETPERADAEVARLNELRPDGSVHYWRTSSRFIAESAFENPERTA